MYRKIEAFKHKFQMAYNRYSLERQIFFSFFYICNKFCFDENFFNKFI